jgi:putative DNA primase/helicase
MASNRHDSGVRNRPWTDMGNAEMFAEVYQNDARYNHKIGKWIVWENGRWKVDTNSRIIAMAKKIPRLRYLKASENESDEERSKAAKFARISESAHRLKSLVDLAKTEDSLSDDGSGWDADPMLLGVKNGVLDLRTGELREARREDRITLYTEIPFSEDAECPRWEQFLVEVFGGDSDLISYVQLAVGYAITGCTNEQLIHILFGEGQNGKSVFLNTIAYILGPYAFSLPFSSFEKSSRGGIPNDIAATVDKRLITASEVDEEMILNEARIKAMTGGDAQSARRLYAEFFNFNPTAKVCLIVNRKPRIEDDSYAIWRRIRLVPFPHKFEKADKLLQEKLKQEAPGILLWAVRGCLLWQNEGLDNIPKAILEATHSYRAESDVVGQFLSSACILGSEKQIESVTLWNSFEAWREAQGYPKVSRRQFSASLEGRGLCRTLSGERRLMTWCGISVASLRT